MANLVKQQWGNDSPLLKKLSCSLQISKNNVYVLVTLHHLNKPTRQINEYNISQRVSLSLYSKHVDGGH